MVDIAPNAFVELDSAVPQRTVSNASITQFFSESRSSNRYVLSQADGIAQNLCPWCNEPSAQL